MSSTEPLIKKWKYTSDLEDYTPASDPPRNDKGELSYSSDDIAGTGSTSNLSPDTKKKWWRKKT